MSRKYYSVFGSNGFGVFTDYEKVMNAKQFLKAFNCKKHNDFEQAKAHAIQEYNQLQFSEDKKAMVSSTLNIPLNWIMYRNKIIEINQGEQ